jgi:hypothetical protein
MSLYQAGPTKWAVIAGKLPKYRLFTVASCADECHSLIVKPKWGSPETTAAATAKQSAFTSATVATRARLPEFT